MSKRAPDQTGAKLGPRIARLVADAMVHHSARTGPHRVKLGMALQHEFFELVGSEIRRTVAPHAHNIADQLPDGSWLADTLRFVANGKGQWATMLGSQIYGSAVGAGLTGVIEPELTRVQQGAFHADPSRVIGVDGAADLVTRGIMNLEDGVQEAAFSGYNRNRFQDMVAASITMPDVSAALALYNRGHLTAADFNAILRRLGFAEQHAEMLLSLHRELVSPQELAALVTFGVLDQDTARSKAAASGMAGEDFDALVLGNGQPPPLGELLDAYRRGIIGEDRLHKGLVQGPTRIEWFDMVKELRYQVLNPGEAVAAAVQGHLTAEQAQARAQQAGVNPADFPLMVENAGRPPGVMQLIELWRRGAVHQSDVEQAIRESDIKTKWLPAVLKFRDRLPEQGMVTSAVRHGALSGEHAIAHLIDLGYDHEVAAWLVATASVQKTQAERDLTKGEVIALYESEGLNAADAGAHLKALGYDVTETRQLLALGDLRRQRAERDGAVSLVRSRYVGYRIGDGPASSALDKIGLDAAHRDRLLRLWDLERGLSPRMLTESQVGQLVKKGIIGADEGHQRLMGLGLEAGDARLLLGLYGGAAG